MPRAAVFFAALLLASCAAQAANTPAAGTAARIDLRALLKAHPLYGALAQYERQIALIQTTLRAGEFSHRDEAITHAAQGVRSALASAANRARAIDAQPTPDVSPVFAAAKLSAPSESAVEADMQSAYSVQVAEVRSAMQSNLAHDRTELMAQEQHSVQAYADAMNERVRQAYNARAQQYYENENGFALDLARADAAQRLRLRLKMQTLALTSAQREVIRGQLLAIQQREDARVLQMHRADQVKLAADLSRLRSTAAADFSKMRLHIEARTAANIAARQRVAAGMHAPSSLALASSAPVRTNVDMRSRAQSLLAAAPPDPKTFTSANQALQSDFHDVQSADLGAGRAADAQIAQLRADRTALYQQLVAQIQRIAQSVARSRRLGAVYESTSAPPRSVDITAAVKQRMLALLH